MAATPELAEKPGSQEFVISRSVDAPRELVWKAWTEPDRLKRWWGPKGFAVRAAEGDLRPEGVFHYCLRPPGGQDMWGKFVYREIVVPERLAFVVSFSDEKGNETRHPLSPDWPLRMRSAVLFTEQDGKTTISVRWAPESPTPSEQKAFDEGHESMRQGWTGTFDQLAAYLAGEVRR
jgi:uncharacterized protein YndB with AHSA1/START domain